MRCKACPTRSTTRPFQPDRSRVRAATEIYKAQRCDGLIAVGGGSAIDCAKGVAIAATHEGPLTHYATIEGGRRASPTRSHLIAPCPPPAAPAARSRAAIIIVDDHRKLGFHSWHLVPKTAICDPNSPWACRPS